jgi:hypothetical protein
MSWRFAWVTEWRERRRWSREQKQRVARELRAFAERNFTCPHGDYLCDKYGCPDDPNWKGDRA